MSSLDRTTSTWETGPISVGGTEVPREYRFSVDQFFRLSEERFFPAEARLELLEGTVVMMSPERGPHFQGVMRCQKRLLQVLVDPWELAVDRTLQLATSALSPDLMVLRGPTERYAGLPTAENVALVVEVADSSRRYDQQRKLPVYAAAGIAEYWIVNLVDSRLAVYRRPTAASAEAAARYESVEEFGPDRSVEVVLDGVSLGPIVVGDLLP